MKTRPLIAAACLLALALGAQAQQNLVKRKPGLWEVQTTTKSPDLPQMPDMNEAMGKMSPEQRAMVEQMMKDRGVGMGSRPNSFRYCLTKQQAEGDMIPPTDPDTHCTHKLSNTSATEAKFSFSCKRKDGGSMEGEGRAFNLTPESYATSMTMRAQQEGHTMKMQTEQKGKWLGADCQGLKPLGTQ